MSTLMDDLKETTRPMHDSAEGSNFQRLLVNGQLSREAYGQYLEQLYLLHAALEGEIQKHQQNGHPELAVVTENQFQEPFLRRDLAHFGLNPDTAKRARTTALLIDDILSASNQAPAGLIGFHYVLLGSKHGGKMVAKNIKDAYGLLDSAGALYFDPYGAGFMQIWMQFKDGVNHLNLPDSDRQAACRGAITMFQRIGQLGDELMAQRKGENRD